MMDRQYNVLFLCTGNSARSIVAEAILNHLGSGKFRAYSAGSHPTGAVNLFALNTIKVAGMSTDGLTSKSWDAFVGEDAPELDFVFTVCDNAAGAVCPIWPGQPMTAHWGIEDPAAAEGTEAEIQVAFNRAFRFLRNRIDLFRNLPIASLDRMTLKQKVDDIGTKAPEEAE